MSKKILAVVLSLILAFSVITVPASALDVSALGNISIENVFNSLIDRLLSFVLSYLNMVWPGYEDGWATEEEYVPENFYAGEETFDKAVDPNAIWKVGYAGASLLDGIEPMNGDFFLAGSLEPIMGRVPRSILDDQRVRVFAISDGVGGIVVNAVIDGFGFSRGDVMEIRSRMAEFAAEHNVISINVSVLHQHSCIDTLGMNVPLAQALIFNTGNAASGGIIESMKVQKNEEFMENLFQKTVLSMKKAVMNMKPGTLSYGSADIGDYIRDKRDPQAFDPMIHRLRFSPIDGTNETWILEAAIHCTGLGAGPDELTADFPYYIEKAIREEEGANVVFVQGAELAIGTRYFDLCVECNEIPTITKTEDGVTVSCPNRCTEAQTAKDLGEAADKWNPIHAEGKTDIQRISDYGYTLATKVMGITNEIQLDPVLNIKLQEVRLDVDNEILTLAAKEDILNAVIVKTDDGYKMVTEIGYMELGNEVGIFLCPGEFDPMLIYGGPESGSASWFGDAWGYAPAKEFSTCDNIMAFGLCNDQGGYVLRDNEYHSIIGENEEVNVLSRTAGSTFANAYAELLSSLDEAV